METRRDDWAAAQATQTAMTKALAGRAVVLVEGISDQLALQALAVRGGRDLDADGVVIVPMGGATNVARFLEMFGPAGSDITVAGLCDQGEEGAFRRGLARAGLGSNLTRAEMEGLGFFVCVLDLEDELVRALGAPAVERVLEANRALEPFRTFQRQPAWRGRPVEQQLRGFLNNWKIRLAAALVDALEPGAAPPPLEGVLAHV